MPRLGVPTTVERHTTAPVPASRATMSPRPETANTLPPSTATPFGPIIGLPASDWLLVHASVPVRWSNLRTLPDRSSRYTAPPTTIGLVEALP